MLNLVPIPVSFTCAGILFFSAPGLFPVYLAAACVLSVAAVAYYFIEG